MTVLILWRYYIALIASGLSVIGWIGALVSGVAAFYFVIVNGPVLEFTIYMIVAILVGVLFARVEKRLYREEQ